MATLSLLAVVVLLLAPALSGCLASENGFQNRTVTDNSGCSTVGENGTVRPGQPLAVEAEASGAPARADVRAMAGPYAGTVDLVFERDGTPLWDREVSGAGSMDHSTDTDGLEAGVYTLTASTEAGVAEVRLELELMWGGGTCS